jgi:F0F1-type ATP synthase membrane subunit a
MFGKKKVKKIDKLVTWVIIGGAIASIFGLSKTKKGQEVTEKIQVKSKWVFWKVYEKFWKVMCKFVSKKK